MVALDKIVLKQMTQVTSVHQEQLADQADLAVNSQFLQQQQAELLEPAEPEGQVQHQVQVELEMAVCAMVKVVDLAETAEM